MQKRIKSFDGTRISYDISRVKGCKKFLVFIHGFSGNLNNWKEERKYFLKKKISTLAVDLRGHGKSDRPGKLSDYNLENFAKDIHQVIIKEKILNPTLVAHSFGGMIAITFHKLFPDISKGYILIGTSSKPPRLLKKVLRKLSSIVQFFNRMLTGLKLNRKYFSYNKSRRLLKTRDRNIFRIFSDALDMSFKSWFFTLENLAKFDGREIVRTIKKPVLILQGKSDKILGMPHARKLNKLIKKSFMKIIPDADHLIITDNPELVAEEIYKFIKSKKLIK